MEEDAKEDKEEEDKVNKSNFKKKRRRKKENETHNIDFMWKRRGERKRRKRMHIRAI